MPPSPAAPPQAAAPNPHMEVIHHPDYNKNVFMPFVPAIKIKSGKILWLAGTTALPVYHDHPHKRDEIQQYMTNDLEAQTRRAMDGIKQTLDSMAGLQGRKSFLYVSEGLPASVGYEAYAHPITYGNTGRRSFFIDETSIIRAADKLGVYIGSGKSDPPLDDGGYEFSPHGKSPGRGTRRQGY